MRTIPRDGELIVTRLFDVPWEYNGSDYDAGTPEPSDLPVQLSWRRGKHTKWAVRLTAEQARTLGEKLLDIEHDT